MNPVSYFEIPAADLERAIAFYSAVFDTTFERAHVDGNAMAFFPYAPGHPGASGALAQGDSYTPGQAGARLYFTVQDIRATLDKAVAAGGRVLYPPTLVGAFGEVAEIEDCEGNCVALHVPAIAADTAP
ncbi:VOC family protein [Xanthomonas sp. A2111]|uniref:VOC family protein n=1 Tax=Xanthomonas hawaiiensis TaxID=3003247 RepID=A0ABU2IA04_9XANT|nr:MULTISPECIES: VOC family protein [unclassified Xanthomonas]MBO9827434.1 VOC family protein [Xanthomonas sp. A2111]MBO9872536.1 VOC family protein [Xanthomonas sp. D-93]MDS9994478.1 VOC family protein [Xanthomonas sp. A2111]WNH46172.1 VOC family protein [Xanthomonas sp. A6251]